MGAKVVPTGVAVGAGVMVGVAVGVAVGTGADVHVPLGHTALGPLALAGQLTLCGAVRCVPAREAALLVFDRENAG